MIRHIVTVAFLTLPFLGMAAATQPTSQPAAPDLSTSIKAALALPRALESGDMNQLKAVTLGTPQQYQLWAATLHAASAARRLQDAAIERFVNEGRHCVHLPTDMPATDLVQTIHGDTADVGAAGEPKPIRFQRIGGVWKLDLNSLPHDRTEAEDAEFDRKQLLRARMYTGLAGMIRLGKFATASDLKQRILETDSLIINLKFDHKPPSK